MIDQSGFPHHIHIVGIGGSATSGLAMLLHSWKHIVTGSDQEDTREPLFRERGIPFFNGHHESNLPKQAQLVIRSFAVPDTNPEITAAKERNIPSLLYSEALGRLSAMRKTIAIAGTHGKTTTTGLLTSIFLEAGRDPTVILGGELESIGGNWRRGDGEDFIVEACEFQKSFLNLKPSSGIITNIELDHPETFSDQGHVEETFREYLGRFHAGSMVVIPADLADRLDGAGDVRLIYFGIGEGDGWRGQIDTTKSVRTIELSEDGTFRFAARLMRPGTHEVFNATAAAALAAAHGIELEDIRRGIEKFQGVKRRFEKRQVIEEVEWYEDYAHHPTEIQYTLEGARELYPDRKIWALFQPHQAMRLDTFLEKFAGSFGLADEVIVLPIYSVREDEKEFPNDLRQHLVNQLRRRGVSARLCEFEQAIYDLPELISPGDVVVSLGAGTNDEIGDQISRSGVIG